MRKWLSSTKSGLSIVGLKAPFFNISGSLYTFPSNEFRKKLSLPLSAFIIPTLSAHSKLLEKEKLFYFDLGPKRVVILRKPEVVEELLKSSTLIQKAWVYEFVMPWLGTGLLTSTGSKWRSRRKLLTPSFHFEILKDFLPIFNEQAKIFADILNKTLLEISKEKSKSEYIDVVRPVTLCTLDIICASTLGVEIGAQRNSDSEYVQAVLRTSQTVMGRMFTPYLWPRLLFRFSSLGRLFQKDVGTLHKFTLKVIRQKQDEFKQRSEEEMSDIPATDGRKRRKALMDLLVEHQMKHHDLTEDDIREEVDTFVFEGHDTTSMGISWALYLIGLDPGVQAKLHEEMDNIFGDDTERNITAEDIRDMRYLDCVLKEAQRLYPSVPMFGREIEEDLDFCGHTIKKGYMLVVFTYLLHREPETFPDPEKFDPDRFLPENSSGRHPFAYIPFSAGPRNCIGQRFALMEEKVVMATILRNFHITSLDQRDKIIVASDIILRPIGPLRLKFAPRSSIHSGVG